MPIATNLQGITNLYIERDSIRRVGEVRTVWLFETFNPASTQTSTKKENLYIDCALMRYEGIYWQWVDQDGTQSESYDSDTRWNTVEPGTPMDFAASFVCSQ